MNKKAAALLAITGSHRFKQRLAEENTPCPVPTPVVSLEPPESLDAVAKEHWLQIMPDLVARRVVSASDLPSLIMLCECWARYRQASDTLAAEGTTYESDRGKVRHPAFAIAKQSLEQYCKLCVGFGIQPANRQKVREAQPAKDNSKERFFKAM